MGVYSSDRKSQAGTGESRGVTQSGPPGSAHTTHSFIYCQKTNISKIILSGNNVPFNFYTARQQQIVSFQCEDQEPWNVQEVPD